MRDGVLGMMSSCRSSTSPVCKIELLSGKG